MSSKQELDAAFKASVSVGEMIDTFKLIQASASFNQTELVLYCWTILDNLLKSVPSKPQQVFSFGMSALPIYARKLPCFTFPSNDDVVDTIPNTIDIHGRSLYLAVIQYVLAVSFFGLLRIDDSLRSLDWALEILTELDKDEKNHCPKNCVRNVLVVTQQLLSDIKVAMGKLDEAAVHTGKALKFKESVMQEGCIELGNAYVVAYMAYIAAKNAKEALPVCLKAVEIYSGYEGPGPRQVAEIRVDLDVLYRVVGEYEKAAEQNRIWKEVLNTGIISGVENAEIKVGNMLIHFGRCEEALEVMSVLASRTETGKRGRLTSFVNMAKAFCILGNFDDAKEYVRLAELTIEKNDMGDPIFVGNTSMNISELYEMMNDLESATSLLKRVFENSAHLQKNLAEGWEKFKHIPLLSRSSTKLLSLISLAGNEKQEIPYMKSVVEKLQQTIGFKSIEVGYACAKLGAALINTGPVDQAAKLIEDAQDIMDDILGPHHLDSLKTRHTLCEIYAKLERYDEAIEIQVKVIEGTKGLEPSEQQFIDKAVTLLKEVKERKLLKEMKERVEASPASAPSLSQDDKDLSAEKSECGPSGVGIRPE